jgi:TPR repeat protein
MGSWHLDGTRGERNEEKALKYLESAARLGHLRALGHFQKIAENNCKKNIASDLSNLRRWIIEANLPGGLCNGESCYALGHQYLPSRLGRTLEKSYEKALYYFERAAALGNKNAQRLFQEKLEPEVYPGPDLADIHEKLSRVKKENFLKAIYYHQTRIDRDPDCCSLSYQPGMLYYAAKGPFFEGWTKEQSGQKAASYFQRGDDLQRCCFMLGKLYFEGRGVTQSYERAADRWRQCMYEGRVSLAELYEKGWGVEKSYKTAFTLYKKVVDEIGLNDGLFKAYPVYLLKAWERLGYLYQHGLGVEKNEDQAAKCFQEANKVQEWILNKKRGVLGKLTDLVIQQRREKARNENEREEKSVQTTKRKRDL